MSANNRVAILCFCVLFSATIQAKPIASSLTSLLSTNNATVGVVVMDAESGKVIYDYHGKQVLTPASNTKLFSAAAALYGLGADYRFNTTVKAERHGDSIQNLVIEFSGDPSLTRADLQMLIHQVALSGVHKIQGDLLIDDHRFALPDYAGGTSFEDLAYYYAAPVNSIIVDGNAVDITIQPNAQLGKSANVSVSDPDFAITGSVKTVDAAVIGKECDLQIIVSSQNEIQLSGCTALSDKNRKESIAVANPKLRINALLMNLLQGEGIQLQGQIRFGQSRGTVELAKHESPRVAELVKHMLKVSDNLYADALLKTLGAEQTGIGSYITGVSALKSILQKNIQLDFSSLHIQDGAGTRFNLMSPYTISQLLFAIYHDPRIQPDFFAALPLAGIDGSLKNRFNQMQVREHVWAKTGSMHDISSLSGYLETKKKHMLIFSLIHNNVLGGTKKIKKIEEQICELLYLEN